MASALIAYLHYVAMISIAVMLVVEYMSCMPGITEARIRQLARIDLFYMIAAILALGSGAARVVWFGKGTAFYLHNPVFYVKLALFAAVGLISIPPHAAVFALAARCQSRHSQCGCGLPGAEGAPACPC